MRILKLPPYYEPEQISSSHLTRDLEAAYVSAGHTVDIFAPMPTRGVSAQVRNEYKKKKYEEKANGAIHIHRFSMFKEGKNPILRALRYILCNAVQYVKGVRAMDADIVLGASTPPTQGVLCALVKKRLSKKHRKNVPFIYSLQDIFPDSLVTAGLTKKNSPIYRIGRKIEDFTYRHADIIRTISEDMKRNIMEKGVPEEKIRLIGNWIDTDTVARVRDEDNRLFAELGITETRFRVVYAGNLGFAQGVEVVVEAAKILQTDKDIEFIIFGAGAAEDSLKNVARGLENLRFFPLLPMERVPEVYSLGHACVVCSKKGVGTVGVPSKTWSIMACSRPLLVAVDEGCELQRLIEDRELGLVSEPENANALAENIIKLKNDKALRARQGANARAYAVETVGKEAALKKHVALLTEAVRHNGEREMASE